MGPPSFARGQPTPRKASLASAGGDRSRRPQRDGRLDDHLTDHTSIYVGNGGIVHVSNYYEYE